MRAFHVGDRFKSKDVQAIVEVRWVDPRDQRCAVVFNVTNQFEDETVFAADFLEHWTLAEQDRQTLAA